ncbi:MAG: alpha-1,4-glucan--maltose-1-phosphate maltosyltransferase [Acidimicrobiales bacterium]
MIDGIRPVTPSGAHPAKATLGDPVVISADIFKDGHDRLGAQVRWRACRPGAPWSSAPMADIGNDRWEGSIICSDLGLHEYVVEAWTARFAVPELTRPPVPDGRHDLTVSAPRPLRVERARAARGAWYELFPRSEGGLAGASKRLGPIAEMGFDVVYLAPIHPIGVTERKGRNNTLVAGPEDPGSPWAIGAAEGGHTAIHPDLGDFDDLAALMAEAQGLGLEVALDYALQCSPDHPWVAEHPEWFWHRPDGTIAFAENPPKKYQDIYPINFWPPDESDRVALWQACRDILEFWVERGVRIFRVDNPHTKPMAFWEWLVADLLGSHPDVILLAEAFTRPKVMAKLAEVGFSQSYSYFTWRHGADELTDYVKELAYGPTADYMRPNFWPNTPDILAGVLRGGPQSAFRLRLVLAATLAASYGIYSGYELGENAPAGESNEEYLDSEKYEIKTRDWSAPTSLAPWIASVNAIRRRHRAFDRLDNITFHRSRNPALLVYSKAAQDDVVVVVVNLDPHQPQESVLDLDLEALGCSPEAEFTVTDELGGHRYQWRGPRPYVRLDPSVSPAHILVIGNSP